MGKRNKENLHALKAHVLDDVEYTPRQIVLAKLGLVVGLIIPFVAMVLILFACVHWDITIGGSEKWVEKYSQEVKKNSEKEIREEKAEKEGVESMKQEIEAAADYVEEAAEEVEEKIEEAL